MANVQGGLAKTTYNHSKKRSLLALAEVRIFQAQVVDEDGKVHVIPIWKCGPNIWTAMTIDGLFDGQLRKEAPKWMVEQLLSMPPERIFNWKGEPEAGNADVPEELTRAVRAETATNMEDDDAPGFHQA